MASWLAGLCESEAMCGKACYNEVTGEARSSQGESSSSLILHTDLLLEDFRLREGRSIYWEARGGREGPPGKSKAGEKGEVHCPKPRLMTPCRGGALSSIPQAEVLRGSHPCPVGTEDTWCFHGPSRLLPSQHPLWMRELTWACMGASRLCQRHVCDPTSSPLSVNKSTAEGLRETQKGEFERRLWINIKYKVL